MVWFDGVDEIRLLVAPDSGASGSEMGPLLSLRHPKSGSRTCYHLNGGTLHELQWFKRSYGSWFLGDYVCEDGRLYTATPIDPVFVLLPVFEEARMKKGDNPGKLRLLDEILSVDGYPGYQNLMSIAESSMRVVCEIKEIGSSKFFRLDDAKVLTWLHYKVLQLKDTLRTLDKNYAVQNDKDTLIDAVSILAEYLKEEPWLELLCNHLKLDLQEAILKAPGSGKFQSAEEGSLDYPCATQAKSAGEKRTRSGKQAKKEKVETNSQNIKDMFCRASRKKS
ncbi:Rnh202, triple barrel domain [Dillenia turbinata]|uniref:Ribonuclease H2 subunit B n=1 Tax=Dillenia turbinata TaxID=194707 RepID=A0AAN8U8Q9_9MAGN